MRYDLWITALNGPRGAAAIGLTRVFGVARVTADTLLDNIPARIKRSVDFGEAQALTGALEQLGFVVESRVADGPVPVEDVGVPGLPGRQSQKPKPAPERSLDDPGDLALAVDPRERRRSISPQAARVAEVLAPKPTFREKAADKAGSWFQSLPAANILVPTASFMLLALGWCGVRAGCRAIRERNAPEVVAAKPPSIDEQAALLLKDEHSNAETFLADQNSTFWQVGKFDAGRLMKDLKAAGAQDLIAAECFTATGETRCGALLIKLPTERRQIGVIASIVSEFSIPRRIAPMELGREYAIVFFDE